VAEIVEIPISDLLLDPRNARLPEEEANQQAVAVALAREQGVRLVNLAGDITREGVDPTTLPAVVATGDQHKRYLVVEGNRRILALKALETPSLIAAALPPNQQTRLTNFAASYADHPVSSLRCVLFDSEDELRHWVVLRHTGMNEGVGLVEWGADEKDRFAARHGTRSPVRQVLEFVAGRGGLSEAAERSPNRMTTSLKRLLNTPEVRDRLGIEQIEGRVYARFPAAEVAKGLTKVVEDLKTGAIKVGDIYYADDRRKYAKRLADADLPRAGTELKVPMALDDLTTGASPTEPPKRKRRRRKKPVGERTTLIPHDCYLDIDPPRINAIYNELLSLNVETYPNAASVLLRVFVELSVDSYLIAKSAMSEDDRREKPLAKRLKAVSEHMRKAKVIDGQLETAINRVADSKFLLAASTITLNQYVHNQYVFPKPAELRAAWDELQPLMERIWA
jgi:hypothetical protein